ncbi:hypothetical protein HPP92_003199 [Vanilla planifolia]|uniref:Transcription factor BREVIS RADIX N-terminal domain-containing protein n=1 Tax=Vanilla planifolia TaxID=51239 RepID=A0A835SF59_VANPL|nr:hypothetical protein HPP92_003199 [Vanilla planifolia]
MAPNPNKPYRVCDSCFNKLMKAFESDSSSHTAANRKWNSIHGFNEMADKEDKFDSRSQVQTSRHSSLESLNSMDNKYKKNKKLDFSSSRVSPIPHGGSNRSSLNFSKSFNPVFGTSKKFFSVSVPGSRIVSRATSPTSRRPSPPRSTTPTPTIGGLISPKFVVDDAKMTNGCLSHEVLQLRAQVVNLTRKAQLQEVELERTSKQLKEAIAIAGEETAKCRAAKEVIKSLTAQLKELAERLPGGTTKNSELNSLVSLSSSSGISDISAVAIEQMSNLIGNHEADSIGSNGLIASSKSSSIGQRSRGFTQKQRRMEANREMEMPILSPNGLNKMNLVCTSHSLLWQMVLKISSEFVSAGSDSAKSKQSSGGRRTGPGCMRNTTCGWLTD